MAREWRNHCILPSVYSFTALSALWDWWRILPRGSWVLMVMRHSPTLSVKGLLVIFPSISCILMANKHLTAVFQDAGKLDSLHFGLSAPLCVRTALSGFALVRTLAEKIQRNLIFHSWTDSWVLAGLRKSQARIEAANIISYSTQCIIFCIQTYLYRHSLSLNYWVALKNKDD